jgi:alkylation response protein AidB-like acyl-CoA dehydrogenase
MQFELNDDQKLLQAAVRDFARAEILPHVMEWDEAQIFPVDLFKKLGEQGFLGVVIPEKYGGAGMGYQDYVIIVEEISKVCPSIGLSVAAHNSLGSGHILAFGSEVTRQKYLPRLATGEWIAAWGLTEAGSGSDAASLKATAVLEGDHYLLNGTKVFCTHAKVGQVAVVMVITDTTHPGEAGAGRRAHLHRRQRAGLRGGGLRGLVEVFQRTAGVRRADLAVSGDPVRARGNGHQNRGGPIAHHEGGQRAGCGREGIAGPLLRQTLRLRAGGLGLRAGRPDPRRLWLYQGFSG